MPRSSAIRQSAFCSIRRPRCSRERTVPTGHPSKAQTIQAYTDRTRAAGGAPIVNHPNFKWALTTADIRPVKRCYLFELYNGHPAVNNEGDPTIPEARPCSSDGLRRRS